MKRPKLEVIPNKPIDKEKAELMQKLVDYQWEQNREFIEGITAARVWIEETYGIETPDQPWEWVLIAYVNRFNLKNGDKDE